MLLDRTRLLDDATGPPILALVGTVLTYAAVVVGMFSLDFENIVDRTDPPSLWTLRLFWIAPALAIATVTAVLLRLAWLSAARLRRRPRLSATLRVAAVLCGGVGAILVIGSLSDVTKGPQQIISTAQARYIIGINSQENRIVVYGSIGHGFAQAIKRALDDVADPIRIEIESPGGLADEALQAAHAIEARADATVVAGEVCESGCIVVLMAGAHRLAKKGGVLGFHARTDVAARSERFVVLGFDLDMAIADIPTDDYLIRRGVPADIVAETNRRGTNDIYNVDTGTLFERGVLTGLVDPPAEASGDPLDGE